MSTILMWLFVIACPVNLVVELVFYRLRRRLAKLEAERDQAVIVARDAQLAEQRQIVDQFNADLERVRAEFEARS